MHSTRAGQLLATLFQAHPWHGLPASAGTEGVFHAYIEMTPAEAIKYELDKATGHLRIDRPQRYSSNSPTLYGFIPQTYCGNAVAERSAQRAGCAGLQGDGDPLDICVITEKAIAHANFFARARPIGGLRTIDGDEADEKIVAILEADISYGHVREIAECPRGVVDRLKHYFLSYKKRPDDPTREVRIAEVYDRAEALEVIGRSQADYAARFGPPAERQAELARLLGGDASDRAAARVGARAVRRPHRARRRSSSRHS